MTEIFERMCPYYMMYGMTYEQYWFGDPYALKSYKELYKLQNRKKNEELWLEGIYTLNAFSTVLANAFKKKGAKPAEYLKKPLDIFPKTEEEQRLEVEEQRKKITNALTLWGKSWNAQHNEKN